MSEAIELVQQERRQQIEVKGWTPEHDDNHRDSELARAAEAYLVAGWAQLRQLDYGWLQYEAGRRWPWGINAMPELSSDPIRNLVKAAALIVAEIERLQRKANDTQSRPTTDHWKAGKAGGRSSLGWASRKGDGTGQVWNARELDAL